MIRRLLIGLVALAALGGAAFLATAVAQDTHHVKALDPPDADEPRWDPGIQDGPEDTIEAAIGDTVSWEFDQARAPHNLFLKVPGQEEPIELSDIPACPGGFCPPPPDEPDPIQYVFEEGAPEGTYVYYCTLHNGNPEGTSGMSGRIVIGEGNGGPEFMPNPTSVGPPWEAGTEPPRLQNVLVRGVNRGIRLRARLSHPGKLVVRMRRGGRVVLTRRYRRLPEGVIRDRIHSTGLDRGRHLVVIRGRDKWGQKARPQLIRERIWVNY